MGCCSSRELAALLAACAVPLGTTQDKDLAEPNERTSLLSDTATDADNGEMSQPEHAPEENEMDAVKLLVQDTAEQLIDIATMRNLFNFNNYHLIERTQEYQDILKDFDLPKGHTLQDLIESVDNIYPPTKCTHRACNQAVKKFRREWALSLQGNNQLSDRNNNDSSLMGATAAGSVSITSAHPSAGSLNSNSTTNQATVLSSGAGNSYQTNNKNNGGGNGGNANTTSGSLTVEDRVGGGSRNLNASTIHGSLVGLTRATETNTGLTVSGGSNSAGITQMNKNKSTGNFHPQARGNTGDLLRNSRSYVSDSNNGINTTGGGNNNANQIIENIQLSPTDTILSKFYKFELDHNGNSLYRNGSNTREPVPAQLLNRVYSDSLNDTEIKKQLTMQGKTTEDKHYHQVNVGENNKIWSYSNVEISNFEMNHLLDRFDNAVLGMSNSVPFYEIVVHLPDNNINYM